MRNFTIHMKPNCKKKSIFFSKLISKGEIHSKFNIFSTLHPNLQNNNRPCWLFKGFPAISIVEGDFTIWEAYGVVNSQIFWCKISLKCEKHFGAQSLQRLFFIIYIWKNSRIGDKNKSNETYIKDFCEKEKMHQGCWISRIVFVEVAICRQ